MTDLVNEYNVYLIEKLSVRYFVLKKKKHILELYCLFFAYSTFQSGLGTFPVLSNHM